MRPVLSMKPRFLSYFPFPLLLIVAMTAYDTSIPFCYSRIRNITEVLDILEGNVFILFIPNVCIEVKRLVAAITSEADKGIGIPVVVQVFNNHTDQSAALSSLRQKVMRPVLSMKPRFLSYFPIHLEESFTSLIYDIAGVHFLSLSHTIPELASPPAVGQFDDHLT